MHSLFVAVAAYRDPELLETLKTLTRNFSDHNSIHLSIHTQGLDAERIDISEIQDKPNINVSYHHSISSEAYGVGWARSVAQKAFHDEDFYLQIDSHVQLTEYWDEILIRQYKSISTAKKPILTAYLPGYVLEGGARSIPKPSPTRFKIRPGNNLPKAVAEFTVSGDFPSETWWFAAGFAFTSGEFIREVPYDPEIFFEGEEITMAIRAYCAGFRLFCPGVFIGAHLYQSTRNGAIESRPHRFWDEDDDADRRIKWHQKNDSSMTKVEAIWRGNWFGIFGIQDLSYYREFMHQLNILFGIKIPFRAK